MKFTFHSIDQKLVGALVWTRPHPEFPYLVLGLERQSPSTWLATLWDMGKCKKVELRWTTTHEWDKFCVAWSDSP